MVDLMCGPLIGEVAYVRGSYTMLLSGRAKVPFDQGRYLEVWRKQADQYRELIRNTYGAEIATQTRYAEAFEVCEYGRQPTQEELKDLFPDIDIQ